MMQHWLESLSMWHWFTLAILLLIGEALGAAGFLLGAALAALLVGAMMLVDNEFSWQVQLFTFATFAVIFTILYWKRFRSFNQESDIPNLNKRSQQLIGKTLVLEHPLPLGHGKIQIGDTLWSVHCDEPVEPGTTIRVVGVEGSILTIVPMHKE